MVIDESSWLPISFCAAIKKQRPEILTSYLLHRSYIGEMTIKSYRLLIPSYRRFRVSFDIQGIVIKLSRQNFNIHLETLINCSVLFLSR